MGINFENSLLISAILSFLFLAIFFNILNGAIFLSETIEDLFF